MRHLGGQKYFNHPTYFQGVKTPNPQDLRPCVFLQYKPLPVCTSLNGYSLARLGHSSLRLN